MNMKEQLDTTDSIVRLLLDEAEQKTAKHIQDVVEVQLKRIKAESFPNHSIKMIDAIGMVCLWVDGTDIDDLLEEYKDLQPNALTELEDVKCWYVGIADLARVTMDDVVLP